jgi:hypothetical protein
MSGSTVLDQFLDPLSRRLDAESARRVLALGVTASVHERIDILVEWAIEGLLSNHEPMERPAADLRESESIVLWRVRSGSPDAAPVGPFYWHRV